MATNPRLATRRRIPKLSENTEGTKGRYYASYRDADGKCQRRRFTRDRKESEQEYRRWVIENYDDSADIVIRDGSGFKGDQVQALGVSRRMTAGPPSVRRALPRETGRTSGPVVERLRMKVEANAQT